jgi:CheY-like chemotaxis protein
MELPIVDQSSFGPLRVLVVDDDESVREVLSWQLGRHGHVVDTAADALCALEKIATINYDIVITDRSMPWMRGDQLAGEIKKRRPATAVILLTGFSKDEFESCPSADVLVGKPLSCNELDAAIAAARESTLSALTKF